MTTYVLRNGELVDAATAPPLHPTTGRTVNIISDHMDPLRHMASGKMFDSKSEFRKETRAQGCVEVGTEPIGRKPRKRIPLDKRQRVDAIKKAIHTLRNK